MNIKISVKKTILVLCGVVLLLGIAHLLVHSLRIYHGWNVAGSYRFALFALFDLGGEVAIPAWYSQTLLFSAAVLTLLMIKARLFVKRDQKYWAGIAGALLYMSVDEGASIHESLGYFVRNNIVDVTSGVFYFSWLPIGITLVALFIPIFGRFWLRQNRRVMVLLGLSAAVFICGAIVMEMLSSYLAGSARQGFEYTVVEAVEECMEMMGVVIFIYMLLDLLRSKKNSIQLKLLIK